MKTIIVGNATTSPKLKQLPTSQPLPALTSLLIGCGRHPSRHFISDRLDTHHGHHLHAKGFITVNNKLASDPHLIAAVGHFTPAQKAQLKGPYTFIVIEGAHENTDLFYHHLNTLLADDGILLFTLTNDTPYALWDKGYYLKAADWALYTKHRRSGLAEMTTKLSSEAKRYLFIHTHMSILSAVMDASEIPNFEKYMTQPFNTDERNVNWAYAWKLALKSSVLAMVVLTLLGICTHHPVINGLGKTTSCLLINALTLGIDFLKCILLQTNLALEVKTRAPLLLIDHWLQLSISIHLCRSWWVNDKGTTEDIAGSAFMSYRLLQLINSLFAFCYFLDITPGYTPSIMRAPEIPKPIYQSNHHTRQHPCLFSLSTADTSEHSRTPQTPDNKKSGGRQRGHT